MDEGPKYKIRKIEVIHFKNIEDVQRFLRLTNYVHDGAYLEARDRVPTFIQANDDYLNAGKNEEKAMLQTRNDIEVAFANGYFDEILTKNGTDTPQEEFEHPVEITREPSEEERRESLIKYLEKGDDREKYEVEKLKQVRILEARPVAGSGEPVLEVTNAPAEKARFTTLGKFYDHFNNMSQAEKDKFIEARNEDPAYRATKENYANDESETATETFNQAILKFINRYFAKHTPVVEIPVVEKHVPTFLQHKAEPISEERLKSMNFEPEPKAFFETKTQREKRMAIETLRKTIETAQGKLEENKKKKEALLAELAKIREGSNEIKPLATKDGGSFLEQIREQLPEYVKDLIDKELNYWENRLQDWTEEKNQKMIDWSNAGKESLVSDPIKYFTRKRNDCERMLEFVPDHFTAETTAKEKAEYKAGWVKDVEQWQRVIDALEAVKPKE